MAGSGATAEFRVTGQVSTMDISAGTEVHARAKVIHPTPFTPRTDRDSSVVIRPTTADIGQDK